MAERGVGQIEDSLFDEQQLSTPEPCQQPQGQSNAKPRLRLADRLQTRMEIVDLDSLLTPDHKARVVWEYVCQLDMQAILNKIGSVEHHPGHPAADPRILLSLWIFATLEGVGSARALNRLCLEHIAYRWICGGVTVNYHTLATFRWKHVEEFDQILTQNIAVLLEQKLVQMKRVSQDGIRVRACAGSASFRSRESLEKHLEDAKKQVQTLRQELEDNPNGFSEREKAARQRAVRERQERIEKALELLAEIEKKARTQAEASTNVSTSEPVSPALPSAPKKAAPKKKSKKAATRKKTAAKKKAKKTAKKKETEAKKKDKKPKVPRCSMGDPEVRVMKMANGGFNPAVNLQFATDCQTHLVVGVSISNVGSDNGELGRMYDQLQECYGQVPEELLADGGYPVHRDLVRLSQLGCTVYAPPMKREGENDRDPGEPTKEDTPETLAWRQRMQTEEAKEIYKQRGATSECVHANMRNHGLQRMPVRGVKKCKAVGLLFALAHNLQRCFSLGFQWKSANAVY